MLPVRLSGYEVGIFHNLKSPCCERRAEILFRDSMCYYPGLEDMHQMWEGRTWVVMQTSLCLA